MRADVSSHTHPHLGSSHRPSGPNDLIQGACAACMRSFSRAEARACGLLVAYGDCSSSGLRQSFINEALNQRGHETLHKFRSNTELNQCGHEVSKAVEHYASPALQPNFTNKAICSNKVNTPRGLEYACAHAHAQAWACIAAGVHACVCVSVCMRA